MADYELLFCSLLPTFDNALNNTAYTKAPIPIIARLTAEKFASITMLIIARVIVKVPNNPHKTARNLII
jgi:hypothetical protein